MLAYLQNDGDPETHHQDAIKLTPAITQVRHLTLKSAISFTSDEATFVHIGYYTVMKVVHGSKSRK